LKFIFKYLFDYRNFNLSGKTAERRYLLNIHGKEEMIKGTLIFGDFNRHFVVTTTVFSF